MGCETHEKPTPRMQPTFGGGDDSDEHRHVRPPSVIVEPEQTCREHARWFSVQTAQVGRVPALNASRSPTPGRPLDPGGDEQTEQPRECERSACDAAGHDGTGAPQLAVQPGFHTCDSIVTRNFRRPGARTATGSAPSGYTASRVPAGGPSCCCRDAMPPPRCGKPTPKDFVLRQPAPTLFTAEQLRAFDVPVLAFIAGRSVIHDAERAAAAARKLLPRSKIELCPMRRMRSTASIPRRSPKSPRPSGRSSKTSPCGGRNLLGGSIFPDVVHRVRHAPARRCHRECPRGPRPSCASTVACRRQRCDGSTASEMSPNRRHPIGTRRPSARKPCVPTVPRKRAHRCRGAGTAVPTDRRPESAGQRSSAPAGDRGRPTPIIESRVTSRASSASLSPSVPAGRSGTTR